MGQRESRLSSKIMKALREEGIFCFKVHGSNHMMAGLPDIIACVDGLFVGLETKLPENRKGTSARQEYVHTQIVDAGGLAFVVCSVAESLGIVNNIRANQINP